MVLIPIFSIVNPCLLASPFLAQLISLAGAGTISRRVLPEVSGQEPCAQVFNSSDGYEIFTAKLAYDCLISAPFNATVALAFLNYYNDTLQFQTTLEILKNPPPSYQQPPMDVPAELASIKQRIQAGEFQNEYAFEVAVQEVVYATHDDHVNLNAGILSAFNFASPLRIVSASTDGIALPKIYILDDLLEGIDHDVDWESSAVSSINGNDTIEFLTQFAAINSQGNIEPHADWNQLMSSPAGDVQWIYSAFEGNTVFYPGENITFGFENGSFTPSLPWLAIYADSILDDPPTLSSGEDVYNYFIYGMPPSVTGAAASSTTLPAAATTSLPSAAADTSSTVAVSTTLDAGATPSFWDLGYPSPIFPPFPTNPVVAQPDLGDPNGGFITGYFLNDGITAVLSIPSFHVTAGAIQTFSDTVGQFLSKSKAARMTRFIIDVQRNSGGSDLLATDTFKQFFPSIDPFSGSRLRAQPWADALGNTFTNFFTTQPITDPIEYGQLAADPWVATVYLNAATGQNFTSWPEFFGPHPYDGDEFTKIQQNNLSSAIFDENATGDDGTSDGIIVYGFGNRSATSPQPYAADQIVILTDAYCSSACGTFLELMHHQAGVRTVVVGGRPEIGAMQAIGGNRGAESYDANALDEDIDFAESVNASVTDVLPDRSAGDYIAYASFNLKDSVRQGEDVPLQFIYEAATCRIFYTTRTVYNYLNLWNYVVDAIWRNPSLCISGSANSTANDNTNTTGPAINDKATVAGPDANIPDLILSGLQSGPQSNPQMVKRQLHDLLAPQEAKRDSSTPPSPTILPVFLLHDQQDDGPIIATPCQACTRQGFTCASVPTCVLGKREFFKTCVRSCSYHHNPCQREIEVCFFLEGAGRICLGNRAARYAKQCKQGSTKTFQVLQTKAVRGGGNYQLPYGKYSPNIGGGPY